MAKVNVISSEPRRGTQAAEEAYLKLVGERVRLERVRRGMSRKVLSHASGVSERYLAELERGSGNASLLVLRQIAEAMSMKIADLASEDADRPIDLALAIHQLETLSSAEVAEARRMLAARFGRPTAPTKGRIALIGLRGAGKSTLGYEAAQALGIPFVELDREMERASGMDLAEILAVHGPAVYHNLERECLEAVIDSYNRAVIACGGSIVASPHAFDLLLSSCFVVWVKASPEEHISRATKAGDLRPMSIGRQAMSEFKQVMESRTPLYAKADAVIDTTAMNAEEVLATLLSLVTEQPEASANVA